MMREWALFAVRVVGVVLMPRSSPPPQRPGAWARMFTSVLQMLVLVAAGVLWLTPDARSSLATSPSSLTVAGWVLAMLAAAKAWTVYDVWATFAPIPQRWWSTTVMAAAVLTAALVAASIPLTVSTVSFASASALDDVFVGSAGDGPVAAPSMSTTTLPSTTAGVPSTVTTTTAATTTTTVPSAFPARWNVLLLGGDAGPGRPGIRTDSMTVVSLDTVTGQVALVSVPRNVERITFPEGPLRDRFPDGFTDLANAVFQYGMRNPDIAPELDDMSRGAFAISSAVAELTGLQIDDFVLVDMAGFVDVVDAIGPLEVWAPKRVPAPGNPPGAKHPVPAFFDAGWNTFDGTNALSYARSRKADSDYARMGRQRCVLASIVDRATPANIASSWLDLLAAVSSSVRTSIAAEDLPELRDIAGRVDLTSARTVSLTPPLFTPSRPDVDVARGAVYAAVLSSAAPQPAPVVAPAPEPQQEGATTSPTSLLPVTEPPAPPADLLLSGCRPES